jgi:hypothetical protein
MSELPRLYRWKLCAPKGRRALACGLAALCLWLDAHAHKPSDAYLAIRAQDTRIEIQLDLALRDLEYVLGLDADANHQITWGELKARHADIVRYVSERLRIQADSDPLTLQVDEHLVAHHIDGTYAVLRGHCIALAIPQTLQIEYRLFFDVDSQHRGLLHLNWGKNTESAVFSPDDPVQTFKAERRSRNRQFLDFLEEGV